MRASAASLPLKTMPSPVLTPPLHLLTDRIHLLTGALPPTQALANNYEPTVQALASAP
jgi:hypothetical protein